MQREVSQQRADDLCLTRAARIYLVGRALPAMVTRRAMPALRQLRQHFVVSPVRAEQSAGLIALILRAEFQCELTLEQFRLVGFGQGRGFSDGAFDGVVVGFVAA